VVKIAVIGLGYVGLPLAVAFAEVFEGTVGFDIDPGRVDDLRRNLDRTGEISESDLEGTSLQFTDQVAELQACTFFVVAVPTPIDKWNRPDLTPVTHASETVGQVLKKGDIVVYESTVFPGVTEEICKPILARVSGLQQGVDFRVGYSPERINPGDKQHTITRIIKVVSGEDEATLEAVASVYGAAIAAGIHQAPSIMVAEAAKVIENTQRDINIALMNELAIIFERMGIRTRDVLAAARTKWNFLPFTPGLVGGHCIGVDPYYLTTRAEELGYHPQMILAGRRINDGMGVFVAQKTVKMLIAAGTPVKGARVGILGLTFKEDVSDIRNSRVPDIVAELCQYGIEPLIHDPLADAAGVRKEYGLELSHLEKMKNLDATIFAVSHTAYLGQLAQLLAELRPGSVLVDVKSVIQPEQVPEGIHFWSL
jgi:UDP-N-acetyl-D-galactosamine dehydrogenase